MCKINDVSSPIEDGVTSVAPKKKRGSYKRKLISSGKVAATQNPKESKRSYEDDYVPLSRIRPTTTNVDHVRATHRPWKWVPCNDCIACSKKSNCGRCGQCLLDHPCILRQCITPLHTGSHQRNLPVDESDNESLLSMESDVSDLDWEDVAPSEKFGELLTPNELWKRWFPQNDEN